MTENPHSPQLTATTRAALDSLRRKIRGYVWLEGLAGVVIWLGAAFWIELGIDWFFEPPAVARGLLLALVGGVLAVIVYRLIGRRAFVRMSDRSMAMLLERKFPQFQETLLTSVELTERRPAAEECNALMLDRTCRLADDAVPRVRVAEVLNRAPLRRGVMAAGLLAASVAYFVLVHPGGFGTWARRSLLMSAELWPRQTRLVVEGFDAGAVKVARGADLDVVVKADLTKPVVPQTVEIRYRTEEGARGRATMSREGRVDRARDRYQEFSHTFRGVLTPITFDVVGGDDAVRGLKVEVVDSPTIVDMELECEYPAYMGRARRTVPVSGPMLIPAGTRVTVHARANKELVQVTVQSALEDSAKEGQGVGGGGGRRDWSGRRSTAGQASSGTRPAQPDVGEAGSGAGSEDRAGRNGMAQVIDVAGTGDRRGFTWEIGTLDGDDTLLFRLLDADDIRSREPVRLSLACLADEAPKLALRLSGIGPAITAAARLPAMGHVTDDYGVGRTWFEYAIDGQKAQSRPISAPSGNVTDVEMNEAFEVGELKLKAGQKLALAVKASDRCDVGGKANVGTSEPWLLDVVTPEQLRAMLESRELVLRQRFESILEEVTQTRDSLGRIEFAAEAAQPTGAGAEPGDRAKANGESPEQALGLRSLRVERAVQNSRKDRHEVLGVAEAFEDIHEELVNNRIDTTELRMRLADGIIGPLKQIADRDFPELDRRLNELAGRLADAKTGVASRDAARQQCDAILSSMRQVLGKMLELEDFNEAVELLRAIIASQEKLNTQTKSRHKETLRDLLEK